MREVSDENYEKLKNYVDNSFRQLLIKKDLTTLDLAVLYGQLLTIFIEKYRILPEDMLVCLDMKDKDALKSVMFLIKDTLEIFYKAEKQITSSP